MELKKLIERLQEIEKKHQDKEIDVKVAIGKYNGFFEREPQEIYFVGSGENQRLWIEA